VSPLTVWPLDPSGRGRPKKKMIQVGTILHVADNTGARKVQCIKVLTKRTASIGDVILVSIKSVGSGLDSAGGSATRQRALSGRSTSPSVGKGAFGPKKGEISRALIVRAKRAQTRKDGSTVKFGQNAVILLSTQVPSGQPKGTRVFGPLSRGCFEGASSPSTAKLGSRSDAPSAPNSGQRCLRQPGPVALEMKTLFLCTAV
jgi:large subunit ribosomal protein L14